MSERVLVVVSADLAHTHLASGPYGYSNASEPFDLVSTLDLHTLHYDTFADSYIAMAGV